MTHIFYIIYLLIMVIQKQYMITQKHRVRQFQENLLQDWLSEETLFDSTAKISLQKLYENYIEYMGKKGYVPLQKKVFSSTLKDALQHKIEKAQVVFYAKSGIVIAGLKCAETTYANIQKKSKKTRELVDSI